MKRKKIAAFRAAIFVLYGCGCLAFLSGVRCGKPMGIIDYDPFADVFVGYRSASITDVILGHAVVADQLQPLDGKTVLDYGCGDGSFCRLLRNYGARTIGADVSERMLMRARSNDSEGIVYMACEPTHVNLPDASVDAVTFNFVLAAHGTCDKLAEVLREAYRMLKVGGTVAILTVHWEMAKGKEFLSSALDDYPHLVSGMRVSGILKGEQTIRVDEFFWSMDDYRALLRQAGFVVTKTLEPIAEDDAHPWLAEKVTPPFMIFTARKVA